MVVAIGFFIIGSPRYVHIPSKDRIISTLLHLLKQSARTSRNGTIVVTGALLLRFPLVLNIASAFSADAEVTARVRCDKDAIEDIRTSVLVVLRRLLRSFKSSDCALYIGDALRKFPSAV
ncbi:hypothetical protein PF010_g16799 [Phytophthora fragariae]|uniref:Uncharacterized protein n=1 Tax=Phytophthora fragariae TaxID=53985 RepID=A0A6G0KQY1_9STRA|nr:hypothetical protein PF010_g16799 [Phytophthora fragariae]